MCSCAPRLLGRSNARHNLVERWEISSKIGCSWSQQCTSRWSVFSWDVMAADDLREASSSSSLGDLMSTTVYHPGMRMRMFCGCHRLLFASFQMASTTWSRHDAAVLGRVVRCGHHDTIPLALTIAFDPPGLAFCSCQVRQVGQGG